MSNDIVTAYIVP